ncbi:MAG: M14 family zinc carboxypeptidase [bacterium]|nr:M14 family zinc carboxypeptidase [bacterium]
MKQTARLLTFLFALTLTISPQVKSAPYDYLTPQQINSQLVSLKTASGVSTKTHLLAKTEGGRDLTLLEISGEQPTGSAILVVANMDGDYPLASEAAVRLSKLLANEWSDLLKDHSWFIVPVGNPDGYARFFSSPASGNFTNGRSVNADQDNAYDEDGPEDLNKDGFITTMRQLHPEGKWIEVESNPLLLKKADGAKGEVGKYRLFPEGIDNDGDGEINEDGPDGVNPGNNFPHDFQHYTTTNGLHAASESETRGVLEFCFDHTEIGMVISFGRANSLKETPKSGRKAEADQSKYKVPERWAKRMGLDQEKEYPIKDLLSMARDYTGYKELTEDQLLQWLGVGAAVNPDKGDLSYWEEISKKYNDYIKEAELDGKRLDPPGFGSGSIEEWSYYQYGVPTFAMDFWTLPEPKEEKKEEEPAGITLDSLENMSSDQFIELGQERIAEFLKANDAPPMYTAEMVINALKGGMMDTKKMAKFMRKSKKQEDAGGADEEDEALFAYAPDAFVAWSAYDHPTLGQVEIGGQKPHVQVLPKGEEVDSLLSKQLPFVRELANMLPKLEIGRAVVERVSSDVFRLDVWVTNSGLLPYPTYQGKRSQRPAPPALTLGEEKVTILEGRARNPLGLLGGSGAVEKVTWLLQGTAGSKVSLSLHSFSAGTDEMTITLTEGETIR